MTTTKNPNRYSVHTMYNEQGRWYRIMRNGIAHSAALTKDYAAQLIALYRAQDREQAS